MLYINEKGTYIQIINTKDSDSHSFVHQYEIGGTHYSKKEGK